jgi:hypothetical protein
MKPKEDEIDGACNMHGRNKNVYKILISKPEGKRQFGKSEHRWDDSIRMGLREIRISGDLL